MVRGTAKSAVLVPTLKGIADTGPSVSAGSSVKRAKKRDLIRSSLINHPVEIDPPSFPSYLFSVLGKWAERLGWRLEIGTECAGGVGRVFP